MPHHPLTEQTFNVVQKPISTLRALVYTCCLFASCLFISSYSNIALAITATPAASDHHLQDAFEEGLIAFKQGDYTRALAHFILAQQQGHDSPRLYYNIGVSHYRLSHYPQASAAFSQAAAHADSDAEFTALAYYNLALVATAEQDSPRAQQWLQRCLDMEPAAKLTALVRELQQQLVHLETSKPAPLLLTLLHTGFDDNVQLRTDDLTLSAAPIADRMVDFFVFSRRPLHWTSNTTLYVDASAYTKRHDEQQTFDFDYFNAGLNWHLDRSVWRLETSLLGSHMRLDNAGLLNSLHLSIKGQRPILKQGQLGLSFSLEQINEDLHEHHYLAGSRLLWGVELKQSGPLQQQLQLNYRYEFNNRADLTSGNTFSSYSPIRQTLGATCVWPGLKLHNKPLETKLIITWRDSHYRDAHLLASLQSLRRHDRLFDISIQLSADMSPSTELVVTAGQSDNHSNMAQYDYQRHQIQFGIQTLW